MKYCSKCLNISTRPNGKFTKNGLCVPCSLHENPNTIDWEKIKIELKEVV